MIIIHHQHVHAEEKHVQHEEGSGSGEYGSFNKYSCSNPNLTSYLSDTCKWVQSKTQEDQPTLAQLVLVNRHRFQLANISQV